MQSIRRFIVLFTLSALTLVIFSASLQGYRSSMNTASSLIDNELRNMAALLQAIPPQQVPSSLVTHDLSVQVWRDGQLVVKASNSPSIAIGVFENGFSERNFSGARWRVYSQKTDDQEGWIMVAHPIAERFALTESLILAAITPLILSIPIVALLIYGSVSFGLGPLRELSQRLKQRDAKDLSPITLAKVPSELQAVVGTLNSLFARLDSAFEREKQFSANAAHELRTPLSVMKINLHNLAAASQQADQAMIARLQSDTDRMVQVVNQLLLLSRTSPELFMEQLGDIDPYDIAQQVISDLYPSIDDKQQQVALEGAYRPLKGTRFSFYTLLHNLLGNAIKYSPAHASIQVTLLVQNDALRLMVEDSGPGVPEDKRQQILQRFYRLHSDKHPEKEGAGLGLAIVMQIVSLYHARLSLQQSSLGGLAVIVDFPLSTVARP